MRRRKNEREGLRSLASRLRIYRVTRARVYAWGEGAYLVR